MKKQFIILPLCCFVIFANVTPTFATSVSAESTAISPIMDYIAYASGALNIDSNGIASVNCSVYGYMGTTTHVEINASLQQYKGGSWISIKKFNVEDDSHRTDINETYKISKGYSYRVQATIKAYSGSLVEIQTVTSKEATY